jgi:hypothetical protein
MGQKKAAPMKSERTGENASLDMNLQDVMDGVEDRLFVIDSEYSVNFANSAMRQTAHWQALLRSL